MRRLSESEKSEIWDGFEAGESQRSISRRLKRPPSTIRTHLLSAGFRRPTPDGGWSSLLLSLTEREEISRGLAIGESMRGIAHRLGRAASTVSREVASKGSALTWTRQLLRTHPVRHDPVKATGRSPTPMAKPTGSTPRPNLRGSVV